MLIGEYAPSVFTTPVVAWSTLAPLAIILCITGVKEGSEDYARHKSDREVNNRTATVLQPDGSTVKVLWRDVAVGSLIRVENRGEVPADVIVLQTSELRAACFVETSNIDGETNLKLKEGVGSIATACPDDAALGALDGEIVYEQPNSRIHTFTGKMRGRAGGEFVPVSARNMLLRGCTLRNTKWIVGLVVFTGRETKVMKKAGSVRSKISKVEGTMNRLIMIIFATQALLVTLTTVAYVLWSNQFSADYEGYLFLSSFTYVIPVWLGQVRPSRGKKVFVFWMRGHGAPHPPSLPPPRSGSLSSFCSTTSSPFRSTSPWRW